MRVWPAVVLSLVLAGCNRGPSRPSPDILLSNLKSDVLASSSSGCAREPGLTLTYFTFDFEVRGGVDLGSGASVYRVRSSAASADAELLGAIEVLRHGTVRSGATRLHHGGPRQRVGHHRVVCDRSLSARVDLDHPDPAWRRFGNRE